MSKPDMCAPDITAEVESGRRQDIQEVVRFLGLDREDNDRSLSSEELTRFNNFIGIDGRSESGLIDAGSHGAATARAQVASSYVANHTDFTSQSFVSHTRLHICKVMCNLRYVAKLTFGCVMCWCVILILNYVLGAIKYIGGSERASRLNDQRI